MKLAILGYGKMGKTIERIALEKGHEIALKINSTNRHELTASNLELADVAIEFSRPETAFDNVSACLKAGLPVVSGTTGWLEKLEEAKTICATHKGAFFYASNFSIGVNLFFRFNRQLSQLMNAHSEYDVQIKEIHHTQKLDYPSGTAITLAEGILGQLERKGNWVAELKQDESKNAVDALPEELGILSVREEGVPGTHKISWDSEIDSIEIIHTAHSREGFAKGAMVAAEWLVGKQGFYGMDDLLKA